MYLYVYISTMSHVCTFQVYEINTYFYPQCMDVKTCVLDKFYIVYF